MTPQNANFNVFFCFGLAKHVGKNTFHDKIYMKICKFNMGITLHLNLSLVLFCE